MPWQWDYDNYSDDMFGLFYPEDINTIIQILEMESKRIAEQQREANRKK